MNYKDIDNLLNTLAHLDHVLFREPQRSATDIELAWDSFNEVLFIYGGVAQLSGVWAFALGGAKQKGSAWRIEFSGSWVACAPQEMPCFPWLRSYSEAAPWLSSLHHDIRAFWNEGLTASMVINHFLYNADQEMFNTSLRVAWCQRFMQDKGWDELLIDLSQDDGTLQRELSHKDNPGPLLTDDSEKVEAKVWALQHPNLSLQSKCKQPVKNNVHQLRSNLRSQSEKMHAPQMAKILKFPRKFKVLLNPVSEKLPLPPFQASDEITPINDLVEFAKNADYMGYSSQFFLYRIIDGFYYLYHINTEYGQATLGIVKRNNRWFGDFITGKDGQVVTGKIKDVAIEWLDKNGSRFIYE